MTRHIWLPAKVTTRTSFRMMMSTNNKAESSTRRDELLEIESTAQRWWREADVFKADSCEKPTQKFFGNIPFPYMNGVLHLGHAFSISKLEFAAAYHRLNGVNVLLPFAFHCTGMPIKAAADKISREIEQYGDPPAFPPNTNKRPKFQCEIMDDHGVEDTEISKFIDPRKWLTYFPPVAMDDLKAFGLGCDWRRSFVTTDINPFFDSFVRWQMNKLKSMGKIVKECRHTIYSPLDGQPCADHDRATGEKVVPQEYTLIKMEVVGYSPKMKAAVALEGKRVFLAAVTLRPETVYGLTNAWVLPEGRYGAFEINDTDVLVLSHRAALNLAYQRLSKIPEQPPTCLLELTGYDLIGLPLKFPLSLRPILHVLPMDKRTMVNDKGTGILTSVPSDVPLDYICLHNLKTKPDLRKKYDLKDEWVLPLEIIPIISVNGFGDKKSAEKVCKDMKIVSPYEHKKIEEATKLIDSLDGQLLVGEYAGNGIDNVKPLVTKSLIEKYQAAFLYYEPTNQVISRSGDECVVALTEQWFITYGESEWKKMVEECLSSMNLYSEEARHWFEHSLNWLNKWACSRSFGLGTRIPWDDQFLVESLSDSSLYMAYYTVSHLLHGGDIYGGANSSSVKPEQMSGDVWDFIFCGAPYPKSSDIPCSILNHMKQEFEYWYPFDLRVSGKDLIQNHLMFCVYNHTAIMRKHHWPRGFRCNGHLMLNSKKMAKSTGNFMTLRDSIKNYGADATRIALADAGDGLEDANFLASVANAAVLRLTKELSWMKEIILKESSLRVGGEWTFADRVFANEMNIAVIKTQQNYEKYMFREALKTGFYNLQAARDEYRLVCGSGPTGMRRDLLWRFMDVQIRLITPICPHFAEYVWRVLLMKEGQGFVVKSSGWPLADEPDLNLKWANKYLHDLILRTRKLLHRKKRNGNEEDNIVIIIVVKEDFDGWNAECLRILRRKYDEAACSFAPNREILDALEKSSFLSDQSFNNNNKIQEICMPFIRSKQDETTEFGVEALDLRLPFGEMKLLEENLELIKTQVGLENMEIYSVENGNALERANVRLADINPPFPGNPTPVIMSRKVDQQIEL